MALTKLTVTNFKGYEPSSPYFMLDTSRMVNVYSRAGETVIEYLFRKDDRETPKEIIVSETTTEVYNYIALGKNGYVNTTTTFKNGFESSKSNRFQTENIVYGRDQSSGSKLYIEEDNKTSEYLVIDDIDTLIANAHYFTGGTLFNTEVKNKGADISVTSAGNPNTITFSTAFSDTNYSLVVRVYDSSGVFQVYGVPASKTTTGFTLNVTSDGFIDYIATSVNGGITDISSVAWANITSKPTFSTVATTGNHTDLSNIGTNTHAQVDTHIADNALHKYEAVTIACSDETTDLTADTGVVEFQMPFAMTVTEVLATVTTAPTGSTIEVDINEGGVSILSTVISIDAGEKTSNTAATPPVISDSSLADNSVITIDIDQVGITIAGTGLKVQLVGYRS